MPLKANRIWAFALAAMVLLPLLHSIILIYGGITELADHADTYLFLLFETPIWATLMAFFMLETYRHKLLTSISLLGCATRMGLFGLLTPLIALLIGPTAPEMSITLLLSLSGCLSGFLLGSVYWILVLDSSNDG